MHQLRSLPSTLLSSHSSHSSPEFPRVPPLPFILHPSSFILFLLLLSACRPVLLDPPREATLAAQQAWTPTPTLTPVISTAPTATGTPPSPTATAVTAEAIHNRSITLWVNEISPEHNQALNQLIQDFTAQSNIHVELIQVMPDLMPDLVNTAALSGTLPDLILHPVEYTIGWAERDILDSQAATDIVEDLGRDTFDPAALELVTMPNDEDQLAAIPSDGWQQLIIYRADWFEQANLPPPITYTALISGAQAFYQPELPRSGLVVPTEADLVSTQRIFEHLAIANGCQIIDGRGEILVYQPPCAQSLDFYRRLINQFSPSDVQTDLSALNAYLAGRTAIIMAPPSVLPYIAGLHPDYLPTCAECTDNPDYLVENSGIVTYLEGDGPNAQPANFGAVTNLGVTSAVTDPQAVAAFAAYWFSEGYLTWLSVEPERKTPMRLGTSAEPTLYLDTWATLPLAENGPSLLDVYGGDTVQQLSEGIAASNRWGFGNGYGGLITTMYEELLMSIVLQEMLSGYFNSEQSVIEAYKRIVALIPDYAYYIELEPTPTPIPLP
jgi:multiple sugar transport system substrate-binding protein